MCILIGNVFAGETPTSHTSDKLVCAKIEVLEIEL